MPDPLANSKSARRAFLKLAAGAAALLPVAPCLASGAQSLLNETRVAPDSTGYRLTPHIRHYYRSAAGL
jgi:hypothetical protein